MNKVLIGAGACLAIAMASPAAWAAEPSSQTFISKAIQGNFAEVAMGQLAQQKGGASVKSFGQMLVTDHTAANDKAMAVAKTLGVAAPTGPSAEQQAMHDKLSAESNPNFDRDFAAAMVDDHKKDIADYQAEAGMGSKDAATQYAADTLPTLQNHLKTAESLNQNGGAATMGAATTSTATTGTANAGDGTPPLAGANSFTEGQAKSRIENAGFTGVSELKKDDKGIWRGTASKGGASVPVAVDFKGNVVGK